MRSPELWRGRQSLGHQVTRAWTRAQGHPFERRIERRIARPPDQNRGQRQGEQGLRRPRFPGAVGHR